MDRPFQTLFTPKTLISYARFLAVLALQPVFQLWSQVVLFLLNRGLLLQKTQGNQEYALIDFRDALFLRAAIDDPNNKPTVTIALTLKGKADNGENIRTEVCQKMAKFLSSDLAAKIDLSSRLTALPRKFFGLWFWEKPSTPQNEDFITKLLQERVEIVPKSASTENPLGFPAYQSELTLEKPWKVFVTPLNSSSNDDGVPSACSVVFVAHRCLLDEQSAVQMVAAFDEECFTLMNIQSKLNGELKASSKPEQSPVWEQVIDYAKNYHGAANYFASLDQCKEKNDFFGWKWTGNRLQGQAAAGIPSQVLEDISALNKVRKVDILHVGICTAFQQLHERNGRNRGLEFVLSALLNPSSFSESPMKASGPGRFWFPTLNGPPETKMWMIKEILNDYGLNKSCDLVASKVVNKIPESLLKLEFSWTFGVTHVHLPKNFKMAAGNSLDFVSFMPGGGGGFAFTCVHDPQTTTRFFAEGDESVLKSAKEIEHICEDVLSEAKLLRNFAAIANPGKQVATMDYPTSALRLQPPPVGERSAARMAQNGSASREES